MKNTTKVILVMVNAPEGQKFEMSELMEGTRLGKQEIYNVVCFLKGKGLILSEKVEMGTRPYRKALYNLNSEKNDHYMRMLKKEGLL